ncbi:MULTISPECIES: hypothetical protein [Nostoc]|uniref:Uncharacterized protein n=2 Tax=Nostoc TaxID=1177 RepID=A0ABR8IJ42_9NOSO|nr:MULTISPECIES: hypothetical protein [Nostoc]MBD2564613.1 hypothetical protein [Nostoc linckia FACHB-391]MBD2650305.1 hypothetical protein [Nostoc foliaceum FACHB-393]
MRKNSPSLHLRSNIISPIQTKSPLVTSSKFLLSREHEPSIQPFIGWDSWDNQDINSEFPLREVDYFDSIASPENNNINSNKSARNSILEIMPTRINNNTSNESSLKINIQGKSKSKKINKSQQSAEKKPKPKSKAKKAVKSSAANNVDKFVDESNIVLNLNEDSLLALDEPLSVEPNSEIPTLQRDIASDNTTIEAFSANSINPIITASNPPSIEDNSTLPRNIANDELQLNSELPSSLPSPELLGVESILPSKEKIELDKSPSELFENSPIEFPAPNNVEELFSPSSNFPNNEQQVISEASESSESVNSSDIPDSKTPSKQNIKTYQYPSIVDNQSTASETSLIQAKEVSPSLKYPLNSEDPSHINNNFETITGIAADLILESIPNNFVTDNEVADNSLVNANDTAFTSPDVDDTLYSLGNDENPVETYRYAPKAHVSIPNSESLIAKKTITVQQEINSSVTSESSASTPVQLTPTSVDIEDTPSLFRNSDNNEQLVTSESQSTMAVNVSDVSANIISLELDGNVENTTSDSTENQPILAPPEIGETPTITTASPEIPETPVVSTASPEIPETPVVKATSPEIPEAPVVSATSPEITEAPVVSTTSPEIPEAPVVIATSPEIPEAPVVKATSPEIAEAPVVKATSSEIAETPVVSATSPEISDAPLTATSSEITETPLNAISPEIGETAMSNDKPLGVYTPLITATSPEIVETPTITTTSPEINETASNDKPLDIYARITATSPEIAETPTITATSPEISDAPLTATSPEIAEAPVVSAILPEMNKTASIFRKIIDNEQTVESEFPTAVTNPEILTFVDTSENSISPQDEVSTAPKVEQNTTIENLPAPKGYATGGHVTNSHFDNRQQIAPSDTVPAMLTPGEFVINTRDAQKNLPLLHHINTGGTPQDIILPSLQTPNPTEPEETTSPEAPTKVDSFPDTSLQLKSAETDSSQVSNSLIPSSLGLNIGKQRLSVLNSPQLNLLQNETIDVGEPSPQYSSPPLIFRKANSTTNTPSQWSSVEDLLNGNNDDFTSFNFSDGESNSQNYEFSHVSESPQVFAKHLPSPRGFADGGEVTPPDISREIEPITETIENTSSSSEGDEKDDPADLEALAREIYSRLRQRIEIERERHGGYSGRLPW